MCISYALAAANAARHIDLHTLTSEPFFLLHDRFFGTLSSPYLVDLLRDDSPAEFMTDSLAPRIKEAFVVIIHDAETTVQLDQVR